jgi:putative flippase GtrA
MAVTTTTPRPATPPALVSQLTRFVLVGGLSAMVDYGIYQLLLHLGVWVHLAKGLSFIAGTTTAYLLNRRWTFQAPGSRRRFVAFLFLYGTTFFVNVGMNALALALLPDSPWRITIAFVIAQGTATTINFVVMRTLIFRAARAG